MQYYAVVYQMGKVASTSIVDTLDKFEHIEAVQCHFVGDKALAAILPTLTDPNISDYFFHHEFGQFIENVKITHKLKGIRSGKIADTKLLVISLSRDPIDWTRSSIVQNIEGYLPVLRYVIAAAGLSASDDASVVRVGLPAFLEHSCEVLERHGGIDAFMVKRATTGPGFAGTIFQDNPGARQMFLMLLRPANWFRMHFEAATDIPVSTMEYSGDTWQKTETHAEFVILRYEDFKISLPRFLKSRGICQLDDFSTKNISETKLFAGEIADIFNSEIGRRLDVLYRDSAQSKFFGYT